MRNRPKALLACDLLLPLGGDPLHPQDPWPKLAEFAPAILGREAMFQGQVFGLPFRTRLSSFEVYSFGGSAPFAGLQFFHIPVHPFKNPLRSLLPPLG